MFHYTNYKKLFRILDDVNINELRWFLYNRKGYFKKFITWLNDYNYMSGYDIREVEYFMLNMCRKSQIPYNLIWVIELFKPKKQLAQFHFYHKFDRYIKACINAGQYNNAKILIENYPVGVRTLLKSRMRIAYADDKIADMKIFYYLCCGKKNSKINGIFLCNLLKYDKEVVLWYHSVRKFGLVDVRSVLCSRSVILNNKLKQLDNAIREKLVFRHLNFIEMKIEFFF